MNLDPQHNKEKQVAKLSVERKGTSHIPGAKLRCQSAAGWPKQGRINTSRVPDQKVLRFQEDILLQSSIFSCSDLLFSNIKIIEYGTYCTGKQ